MYKFPFAATLALLSLATLVHPQNRIFGSDVIGELRLVDGPSRCQGRLEIRSDSSVEFGTACDNDIGSNEATVICRQLNCGTDGATAVPATTSSNVFRGFGYVCNGDEPSITSCQRTGSVCSPSNGVGIECAPSTVNTITGSSALSMVPLVSCVLIMAVVSLLL